MITDTLVNTPGPWFVVVATVVSDGTGEVRAIYPTQNEAMDDEGFECSCVVISAGEIRGRKPTLNEMLVRCEDPEGGVHYQVG